MPCINLRNTFAYWQVLDAQKRALAKAPTRPAPRAAAKSATPQAWANGSSIKVPHASHVKKQPVTIAPAQLAHGAKITAPVLPKRTRKDKTTAPVTPKRVRPSVRMTRADLINAESKLGSTIFGPIPAGHRREFFHDQKNIWIWHEDWYDGQHNPHQMTVRYEVRTSGIYKKVATGKYLKLEGDELDNFRKATHAYLYVVKKNLYNKPQTPAPSF